MAIVGQTKVYIVYSEAREAESASVSGSVVDLGEAQTESACLAHEHEHHALTPATTKAIR